MKNFILEHWNSQAETHGVQHSASWGDIQAINLEVETIGRFIKEGSDVLDAGCANGYSALRHLDKKPRSITGIDFSPKMIEQAQQNKSQVESDTEVSFQVGDIRNLPFPDGTFDVVYTTRTLINLPLWTEQIQGIEECVRV